MTLCGPSDKLGPMTRSVEDAMLVLQAISGPDAGDVSSVSSRLDYDAAAPVQGLRVGYFPRWMEEKSRYRRGPRRPRTVKKLAWSRSRFPFSTGPTTRSTDPVRRRSRCVRGTHAGGGLNQLKAQVSDAWPNLFRQARFLSAVDFVQADRLRRQVAQEMARVFSRSTCCSCLHCAMKY